MDLVKYLNLFFIAGNNKRILGYCAGRGLCQIFGVEWGGYQGLGRSERGFLVLERFKQDLLCLRVRFFYF